MSYRGKSLGSVRRVIRFLTGLFELYAIIKTTLKEVRSIMNSEQTDCLDSSHKISKRKKILEIIQQIHLYDGKGESLFKTLGLWVSWVGGVYNQDFAAAYFLFSCTIIMEYAVQLVITRRFIPKILPFILIISNAISFILSCSQLLHSGSVVYYSQVLIEIGTLIIISIDSILMLLFESPNHIEATLSEL